MLLLFTFALMLIIGDVVKFVWGADYRSVMPPEGLRDAVPLFGTPIPRYNLFLLAMGPVVAIGLWFFNTRTRIGKIARGRGGGSRDGGRHRDQRQLGCSPRRSFWGAFWRDWVGR